MILYTDILYNIIYIIYIYLGEANKAVRCPHTPEGDCNRRRAKPVAPNGANLPSQRLSLRRPPQHVQAHSGRSVTQEIPLLVAPSLRFGGAPAERGVQLYIDEYYWLVCDGHEDGSYVRTIRLWKPNKWWRVRCVCVCLEGGGAKACC